MDGISQLRKVQLSVAMQKARLEIQERLERSKMTASQLESWIASDCLLWILGKLISFPRVLSIRGSLTTRWHTPLCLCCLIMAAKEQAGYPKDPKVDIYVEIRLRFNSGINHHVGSFACDN